MTCLRRPHRQHVFFPELLQAMALDNAKGRAHEVFRTVIQVILDQGFSDEAKAFDAGSMGAMCMRLCQS